MIYVFLFLISIIFFPNITSFSVILMSIYIICTLTPKIGDKKRQKKEAKSNSLPFYFAFP